MAVSSPPQSAPSGADAFMLRLLRLPADVQGTDAEARSAFQQSIVISSIRCLLTYIILPFVAPTIGVIASIGPVLGIIVSLVAMVSITISMRRFWRVRHAQRWAYTTLGGLMFAFLVFLIIRDVIAL